jgi:glutamyl-tRNA synthetase
MSVRVRFAPSPTGYLHIGGARTALYNYLFAKAQDGKFILRIEDTDKERSEKKYEELQIEDLLWLGIEYDEGPGKENPKYGSYHQSERLEIYMSHAKQLLDDGLAFYDFCTDSELEVMRESSEANGTAPYTGKWREASNWDEAKAKVAAGKEAPIRFKVDPSRKYSIKDHVRGNVTLPASMVGDFVVMRSNGIPTYNFCNVIDDHLFEISHVLRGEEHLNNSVRQLMIYEAYSWTPPEFAHLSLMIGSDKQKLSKRHGATSVHLYKEESYQPEALNNYLCLLGWSHPEEKSIFTMNDLKSCFDISRFNKAPAMYDIEKLKWTNGEHLKAMDAAEFMKTAQSYLAEDHFFHKMDTVWKETCLGLFQEKIKMISELSDLLTQNIANTNIELDDAAKDVLSWETTPQIISYINGELSSCESEYITSDIFSGWMDHCKKELGIKGKPLFMGFRVSLTGQNHGPDLKVLIPLTKVETLKKRLEQLS